MHYFIFLFIIAAISSLAVGLLGVGFSLVILPALIFLLPKILVGNVYSVKIAIATTLAGAMISASSATIINIRYKHINHRLLIAIMGIFLFTAIIGPMLIHVLPMKLVEIVTAGMLAMSVLYSLYRELSKHSSHQQVNKHSFVLVMLTAGLVNSMCGIGVGNFLVPFLNRYYTFSVAKGTSLASTLFSCAIGTLGYIIGGWNLAGLPQETFGYIYLPAFFVISIAAFIATPVGVYFGKRFDIKWMRFILFGVVLLAALQIFTDAL